jgi:hypothetical protein
MCLMLLDFWVSIPKRVSAIRSLSFARLLIKRLMFQSLKGFQPFDRPTRKKFKLLTTKFQSLKGFQPFDRIAALGLSATPLGFNP